MELRFNAPIASWRKREAPAAEVAPTSVPESSVSVEFPVRESETNEVRLEVVTLPCAFTLSFDDEQALLKRSVTFRLQSGGRDVASHTVTLGECIPVLEDSQIDWTRRVSSGKEETQVHVTIPIATSRRPREAIANALAYRDQAVALAQKNAVAIGLLPPILGCFVGVILTTPLWLPLTLLVGILGFPLWVVVAIGASLLIAISAISSVITVKAIQSRRVKSAMRDLAQSPGGQYVLFANSGNTRLPSPAQLAEQLKMYVNEDPSRKLLASLLVDFIGNATFVLPGVGELADVLWAPASASFVSAMYSESTPSAKYFAFLEEFLPFTDFIPTATLAWLKENLQREDFKNAVAKLARPKTA